ncbi:MAG: glycosyltransferase family 1 protein [Alcaligenaceae bacterium]|nr:glycosyltransferase family 1 protein [Alcaligenaceae bacterium]
MKLLIITDAWSPQVNGVVFTLGQTCRELSRMGHQVEVIQPGLFRSVPCPSYPEIPLSLATPAKLKRLIEEYEPDAVHIATEGPLGLAARRYLVKAGRPFTTAYHTRFPEYVHARTRLPVTLGYRWLRRFHGAAARTMVPTAGMREDLLAHGFDPGKVVVWSRGVDLQRFNPAPPPDETPITPRQSPVFLYAGRVAVEKNLDAFLNLDLPGEKWVVGGGPALDSMKARYPHARFFGPRPQAELARYYRQADVFVFPSLTDTFGLVLLEAMACGCPVGALPARSTLDVLGDSGAGAVNEDLRHACLQALAIPRETAAAHAQNFSWTAATQTFLSHLQPLHTENSLSATFA